MVISAKGHLDFALNMESEWEDWTRHRIAEIWQIIVLFFASEASLPFCGNSMY